MKVLITGVSGFIGANLLERLLDDGHEVFGIDNYYSSSEVNISWALNNKNFKFFEHDILEALPSEFNEISFDQIYHLACPASPPRYQKDHIYTLRTNFEGTLNVLNFMKLQRDRFSKNIKLLFSSTSEVYGDPEFSPQAESYRGCVNPHGLRSCYDEGKRVAESLVMNFWRQYDLDVKIIRIFNTYGPRMDADDGRVVSNFIVQAISGENLTVYGDGRQSRSFQYIDDLLDGMIKYMELNEKFPGPINLGNPNEISILELAKRVGLITGVEVELKFSSLPQDDPMQRCPDISLAKEKLKWEPIVDIDSGLKKTVEYFRNLN